MLERLYLTLCDMALPATLVIVAVLAVRLLLRRAPKVFSYALWAVVLFRLLCPVTITAPFGLTTPDLTVTESYTLEHEPVSPLGAADAASRVAGDVVNGGLDTYHYVRTTEDDGDGGGSVTTIQATWRDILVLFGGYVWAAGVLVMLVCGAVSLIRLRRRLTVSVRLDGNVYLADDIPSPCVVGLFRPRIYLPSSLSEHERDYILMHERHHIRRGDHIWRLLAYIALCLHWTNPLVWLAFVLSGKDMEMSCDEAVMRKMDSDIRADYAQSLLSLATGKRRIAAVPLYFGEGDTGARVKNVLKYKKPLTVIVILAAAVLIAATVLLATTAGTKDDQMLWGAEYTADILLYDTTDTPLNDTPPTCIVTADLTSVYYGTVTSGPGYATFDHTWGTLALRPYPLKNGDLSALIYDESGWQTSYRLPRITDAYIAQKGEAYLIVAQTAKGDTLLAEGASNTGITRLMRLKSCFAEPFNEDARPVEMPEIYTQYLSDTVAHVINADVVRSIGRGGHNGFVIFGFASSAEGVYEMMPTIPAEGEANDLLPNMGFAVFEYHQKVGYRLIDCHVYENAAVEGNGIYLAEDLAVADRNGRATRKNTYEVLLINSDRFDHLERRTRHAGIVNIAVLRNEEPGNNFNMILFPRENDPIGQDIFMTYYDIDGNIMVADTPERVSVTRVIGNTVVRTSTGNSVVTDPEEALALVTEIENFPYLEMDHPIYGGYDWRDGFIVRIEYVVREEFVLHDDMRDCFILEQDGAYYLVDDHADYRNCCIRQITEEFYRHLQENYTPQQAPAS